MSASFIVVALGLVVAAADAGGVRLSARGGGGVVGGDGVGVVEVGVGVDSAPLSLHLRAPLLLRVVDLPPTAATSSCRPVRCDEWTDARGAFAPASTLRVLDELRLFQPGDLLHLRAGRLVAGLGAGAVVDRVTTMASWDRRTAGAWGALRAIPLSLAIDTFVADVTAPWELAGARVSLRPTPLPIVVGADVAADVAAPLDPDAIDARGDVAAGAESRAVVAGVVDAHVPLDVGPLSVSPRLELGVTSGLARDGRADEVVAVGVGGGADVGFDAGFFDVVGRAVVGVGSAGHRRGLFSTFHLVERRRALAGSVVDGGGLVHVPAPGGVCTDLRLQASVLDAVSPFARLHLEAAPGANLAELGIAIDIVDVSASASVLRRGFVDVGGVLDGNVGARPVIVVLEAGWRFFGPLSASVRWFRLPRFAPGGVVFDDDVLVTLSIDTTLTRR
ncbi:MAG TPA: hypothetical protein VGF99_21945 [Myxococcota bacterium]